MQTERIQYEGIPQETFVKELESLLERIKSGEGFVVDNRIGVTEYFYSHFVHGTPHYGRFLKQSGEKEFVVEFTVKVWK